MKLLVQRLFFFAVLCISLSSCFKAGPGVIDPDDPMFFPQGGTSFITRTRLPDAPNQPYELWDTIRVVRKGLQMDGKTNVSE